MVIPITGGSAQSDNASQANQGLTVNSNPIFDFGSGGVTSSGTQDASTTPTASASPIFSQYPTGAGLAGINTAYPGSAALPATSSALSSLTSDPTLMLLVLGAALLLIMMPEGRRK